MAELPFQDSTSIRSIRGVRRHSPDSVINTTNDFNFSPFSSSSASADRSSVTSDSHSFDFSQHVAALDIANGCLSKKQDKQEGHKHEDDKVNPIDVDDEAPPLVSARNSFSLALKDCQERRLRSQSVSQKTKPAGCDVTMKKPTVSSRKSSNFPSPVTPTYPQPQEGVNKGWQSERVACQTGANKRLSFNNGRNQLPSKWEDAERWIISPIAGDGNEKPSSLQKQKRPKSKSGPLGAPGIAYYAQFSPGTLSMYDDSSFNSLIAAAGVLMPSGGKKNVQHCDARSPSVNGCSNLVCQSSGTSSRDEKVDDAKHAPSVSKKDAATQMSPKRSSHSSRSSFTASTPSTKPDVRDVQVDERVTVTRWSKKHKTRIKASGDVNAWRLKAVEAQSEASESLSKAQRDEAKIQAWENLQKTKADEAIRKLEMKLEKRRSRTIDKIMTKLRSAENKAQEMRSSIEAHEESPVSRTSFKAISRSWQISSLRACFTPNAL